MSGKYILVIGKKDKISYSLLHYIEEGYKAIILTPEEVSEKGRDDVFFEQIGIAVINLSSINKNNEKDILDLMEIFDIRTVAVGSFNIPKMITTTLQKGYTNYVSIFEVNNIIELFSELAPSDGFQ